MTRNFIIYGAKIGDYFVHIGAYREGVTHGLTKCVGEYPDCTLWQLEELGDCDERTLFAYRDAYRNANGLSSGPVPRSIVLQPSMTPLNFTPTYSAYTKKRKEQDLLRKATRPRVRRMRAIFVKHHKEGDPNGFWDFMTQRIVLVDTSK